MSEPPPSARTDSAARISINGVEREIDIQRDRSLLHVLREELGLTGSKYGCGEGECGACTVLLDGHPVRSCVTSIREASGRVVTTIEGFGAGEGGRLHPVQEAFLAEGAFQCGYCTPGLIVAAVGLLQNNPRPTELEVRSALNGNICRCGGYTRILAAVMRAADRMGAQDSGHV